MKPQKVFTYLDYDGRRYDVSAVFVPADDDGSAVFEDVSIYEHVPNSATWAYLLPDDDLLEAARLALSAALD